MRVQLTGPREGQTVHLNGTEFVNGVGIIDDGAFLYYSRCWKVVPYGPSHDEAADAEWSGPEVPGTADVQSEEHGTGEAPTDASDGATSSTSGSEGSISFGDGHSDAGLRGSIGEDPLGQALTQLDPDDDSQWKADGSPRVDALAKITGGMVTKEMADARFSGGEREATRQGQ